MSKAKFLDTSLPLKDRQRSFLKSTIEHYSRNPKKYRCTSAIRGCKYSPYIGTKGCAIGRHISPNLQTKLDGIGGISEIYDSGSEMFLPEWMRDLTRDFLDHIQQLHDDDGYWSCNEATYGLTKSGERHIKKIRIKITNGYTN